MNNFRNSAVLLPTLLLVLSVWAFPAATQAQPQPTTAESFSIQNQAGEVVKLTVPSSGVTPYTLSLPATAPFTGDLFFLSNASGNASWLNAGTNGQVLTIAGGLPTWQTINILPTGTTNNSTLVWDGVNGVWTENTNVTMNPSNGNITTSGNLTVNGTSVNLPNGSIDNSELANNTVNLAYGTGVAGDASVALGGTLNLQNTGVTSLVAGTGINLSGSTGAVTVSSTGLATVTTNATLTGDGTSGSPLGINLANANSWTGAQTFSSVDINGGTIDGTSIGATARSTGAFTSIGANAGLTLSSATSPLTLNGSTGTANQVMISNGVGATPSWVDPSSLSSVTTDATLTGNGSPGNPLGINLANPNTWTGAQTFNSAITLNTAGGPNLVINEDGVTRTNGSNTTFSFVNPNFNAEVNVSIDGSLTLGQDGFPPRVGQIYFNDDVSGDGFLGVIRGATPLTASRTYTLPDATGTIALVGDITANAWSLTGNASTSPGTNFLGTTDLQPVAFRTNNVERMRLGTNYQLQGGSSTTATGANAFAWGSNSAATGVNSAISGGDDNAVTADYGAIGGGKGNRIRDNYGVIAGGNGNTAGTSGGGTTDAQYAAVGGGDQNTASAHYATVGGGRINTASGNQATISGGRDNQASGENGVIGGGETNVASANSATVAGGNTNTASGIDASVGGGESNTASGDGSVVSGGRSNTAAGLFSAIPGGVGMTLTGAAYGSFGFMSNGADINDLRAMTIATPYVAAFGNTDLWLANNDNSASQLRFYEPNSTTGAFPGSTNYTAFRAGTQGADITYTLPTTLLASATVNGLILQQDGTGVMSWVAPSAIVTGGRISTSTAANPGTGWRMTISDANVSATNVIVIVYEDPAGGASRTLYIGARTVGTSFVVHFSGAPAAGSFVNYHILP
ncbi:MAG: beta strand repeat-containing protein [Candidatus Kapaibacterium sp.]